MISQQLTEALDKTFGPNEYLHLQTQTLDTWFLPLEDQKNGGLSGLQVTIKDSGRPGNAVQKSLRSSERSAWKKATPPDDVKKKFEAHALYPSS